MEPIEVADSRVGDSRARVLLGVGVFAGLVLAAMGVARPQLPGSAAGLVARVDGEPIRAEAFARFVARSAEQGDPASRRVLLGRAIDEELLLQRGLALGLAHLDASARGAIVAAVVSAATAGTELGDPSEAALRAFHAEASERFTAPDRLRLDSAWLGLEGSTETRAYRRAVELARRASQGEPFAALREALADGPAAELPAAGANLAEIGERLGAKVARVAGGLSPGEVSSPVRGTRGWLVLRLVDRSPGAPLPFEEVRAEVRVAYLRRARERALERYLAELRARAEIEILDAELRTP